MNGVITINKLSDTEFTQAYRKHRAPYFDALEDFHQEPDVRILAAIWLIDDLMSIISELYHPDETSHACRCRIQETSP